MASERTGTCVAVSDHEEAAYLSQLRQTVVDQNRESHLKKLVKLRLPSWDASSSSDLAVIRKSGIFEEWRGSLRDSLAQVGDMDWSEASAKEATGLVQYEMKRSTQHLVEATNANLPSKVRKALEYDFGLSLVGIVAGAGAVGVVTGTPLASAVGGIAGALIKDGSKALPFSKEGKERNSKAKAGQAVANLLLTFKEGQ